MKKGLFSVRDICEIAMLCAIAIVLGLFCDIKVGQNGGSIGFSMIPLFFIAYRHGIVKGFIAGGVVYGLVTCIVDGYGFACYPFDYLLAFGLLSVVALFYKPIFEGTSTVKSIILINVSIFLACFLRFAAHVLSGVILWDTAFWGSVTYNIIYVGPSCILCMILFSVLFKPLKVINKKFPVGKRI